MLSVEFQKFSAKTDLIVGPGSIQFLADEVKKVNPKAILVVTDKGLISAGITDRVLKEIEEIDVKKIIFDEVKPNPDVEITDRAYQSFKDKGIELIISIGGGSVTDSAKGLAVLFTNGGSIADYFGFDEYKIPALPIFAIPTTAGTGSEGGNAAVFTENETMTKKLIFGESLFPKVAFLDAKLLQGMPRHLVASTGMDALTHAIEGYVSRFGNVVTDAMNLHSIRVISSAILPATANSDNLDAINAMLQASTCTGIGMANSGLGMVHGISHAIGGQYDAPHGLVNAILLPYLLEYNWIANPEKFAHVAEALRVNIHGMTVEEAAKAAVEHVKELSREVGIPEKLSAIGVDDKKIDLLTDIAFNDQLYMRPNPRKMTREDIKGILIKAI